MLRLSVLNVEDVCAPNYLVEDQIGIRRQKTGDYLRIKLNNTKKVRTKY